MSSKKLVAIVSAAVTIGIGAGFLAGKMLYTPKKAYKIWDYNRDGFSDLTVELNNGKTVILYNAEKDDQGEFYPYDYYLSDSELKK